MRIHLIPSFFELLEISFDYNPRRGVLLIFNAFYAPPVYSVQGKVLAPPRGYILTRHVDSSHNNNNIFRGEGLFPGVLVYLQSRLQAVVDFLCIDAIIIVDRTFSLRGKAE